jgi:hypothetical protein
MTELTLDADRSFGVSALRDRLARLSARLGEPTDAAALSAYRVAFGLMMSVSAFRFLHYGWVDELFVKPRFFFKYWGFGWVPVPGPAGVHAMFWGIFLLGLLIAAGLFYRAAMAAFFVLFAWVQLMDVTNYLNHYYLVSLLGGLMALMPLGRAHSLDALLFPKTRVTHHPFWCTAVLRFQVAVLYFFAAIAKATPDWLLHAQPLSIWLAARTGLPVLGPFFSHPWTPWVMSWSGFLYDLTIWALLLWGRTRRFAYVAVLGFHAMTSALFPIGMFPVIMVVTALVFFDPSWPRAVLARLRREAFAAPRVEGARAFGPMPRWAMALAAAYCAAQIAWPLRTYLYGGNVLWHEQGMRWSWRVMCREKNASVTYWVTDRETGRTWAVEPAQYLTDRQYREFGAQPDLILQLGHHVGRDYEARTGHRVAVRVEALVSLNGRPAQLMVDRNVDLMDLEDGLAPAWWILPEPSGPPARIRPIHA